MVMSRGREAFRRSCGIRVRGKDKRVTLFVRQMATLLHAGLPIMRSLDTLIRQERQADFCRVLNAVADRIRGGSSFSEALAPFPAVFDHLLLSMVRAGEAGGNLPVVLGRLAEFREKSARVRAKVRAALVYPIIVMTVAVVIVGLLMAFVVPQFQEIFHGMLRGQPLPWLTQMVVDVSNLVKRQGLWLLAGGLLLSVAARTARRSRAGKQVWDRMLYWAPGTRSIVQRNAIARFFRTFGTLVQAGVPMLECLQITRSVVGNGVVQDLIDLQHARVRDGDPLAAPLEETKVFPPMVASMVAVGEETGQLPLMCDRIADTYEEEIDTVVAGLTSVIEPVMIVILALVVGTVVIALFLPIVSIIQNLSAR